MKKKSAAKPDLQKIIVKALEDLKAQNIVILDVSGLSNVFDTMIIASGSSNRQVRALAEHAAEESKKQGTAAMGIEGLDAGEWVLVDFGDAVLHVMQPEIREFYDLESLWQVTGSPVRAQSPATKSPSTKPPATKSPATKKPSTSTRTRKSPAAKITEEPLVTQSDAAKARKSPPKPKTAVANKDTTAKAGVRAKTGTRKPATSKPAAKKPAARKPRPT